jgi:spore coat polysaccharide biosynthesis predicted glycosyltransferase SpsG
MFLFCVESSHAKGMGHLFRVINLHRMLRERGQESSVVLLGEDAASQTWLASEGVAHRVVEEIEGLAWEAPLISERGAKVWINDRLNTGISHAKRIKEAGLKLVTFDDAGPGASFADIHVAALASARGESPAGKRALIGTDYLVFPPEVARLRKIRTDIKRLLVTLGGSDTHGATIPVAEWLNARGLRSTIVLGPAFAHGEAMSLQVSENLVVKRSVPSLIEELAAHDFAITGGGLTAFEAAALGVPTAIVANEPWEVAHANYLQSLGCSVFVGAHDQMNLNILDESMDFECMSEAALRAFLPDGANRVITSLLDLLHEKG